jgi:hypothetical protein
MEKVETFHIVLCGCGVLVAVLLVLIGISVKNIWEHDEWIRDYKKGNHKNL